MFVINLYFCLKEFIKEEGFKYSFNDYDANLKKSIAIVIRDGIPTYRELETGKYINESSRVEIIGVAGKTKEEVESMEKYLYRVKEKLEMLNNKYLNCDSYNIFVSQTNIGSINSLGKSKQENTLYSMNFIINYGVV